MSHREPCQGDALLIVDVQIDFLPGGSLAVPHGDEVVPVLNHWIDLFRERGLPVFATRDWHPADHCSFVAQGGPWPPHCVVGTAGARFSDGLRLPAGCTVISKDTRQDENTYSGFEGTDLAERLRRASVTRLYIGGLATDYCVLNTVKGAIGAGFQVFLLLEAVRPVEVNPGDGKRAVEEMKGLGAVPLALSDLR
jgi:nicotinamidase/pyrazinamidase